MKIYIYIKKIEYWLHGITIGASRARQLVDIMKYFTGQQDSTIAITANSLVIIV